MKRTVAVATRNGSWVNDKPEPAKDRGSGYDEQSSCQSNTSRVHGHPLQCDIPLIAFLSPLSESIRKFPETTIVSPAFSPERITALPSTTGPIETFRGSNMPPSCTTKTCCSVPELRTASCGTRI